MQQRPLPISSEEPNLPALPPAPGDEEVFRGEGFIFPALNWMARRTEVAALLMGLLVALCFVPHVTLFEQRDAPARSFQTQVPGQLFLEAMEYRLYDERFTRRGTKVPASRDKIAIVKIDANSLQVLNEWPWPRSRHAQLIRRLKQAGAKVIALDIDFSSKQFPRKDGSLSEDDKQLVAATRDAGNVIFPSYFSPESREVSGRYVTEFRLTTPYDEADVETPDPALAYLPQDSDGGYRRYPFSGMVSGATIGSFAGLACGVYQGLVKSDGPASQRDWKLSAYEATLKQGTWPKLGGSPVAIPRRRVVFEVPEKKEAQNRDNSAKADAANTEKGVSSDAEEAEETDSEGADAPEFEHMLFNYWGAEGSFPSYSYSDVLLHYDKARMSRYFKDRIVFVGATDLIFKDVFPVPTFKFSRTGEYTRPVISGVELHATAAAMLLDGDYIRPPKMYITLWCMFGLTLFSAAWTEIVREHISRFSRVIQEHWHKRRRFRRFRFRVQDTVWFGMYGVLALLPAYLYWQACVYFFVEQNRWVVAAYPIVSSVMASAVVLVFLFTIESAERRKVIFQMGLYMDEDIMEEVLAHPEGEYAKPRRTAATVIFTDLEGFTAYSEKHDPREVVAALNSFMTRMKPIVKRYGGTVDKFIGDAIMAFFGVPIERYDHAERALACAIELQEECVRFREETGIDFKMRIGIHTGEVIAGSMGAEGMGEDKPHFNFTVIGDTVNLASRLEGKNKEFGSWIMCSSATYLIAPDIVEVVPARTNIKGKSSEVEVYIVRGLKGHEPRDEAWGGALHLPDSAHLLSEVEQERALMNRAPHELEGEPVPVLPALPAPGSHSD